MITPSLLPAAIAGQLQAAGIQVLQLASVIGGPGVYTTAVRPEPRRMPQALRQGAQIMASLDATGQARAYQHGAWLIVEVPRPDPRPVPLSALQVPAGQIALGMTGTGTAVAWDPANHLTAHALLAAQNGAGKSVALRTIALGAAALPGARLVLIDLKPQGDTWGRFVQASALTWPVATDAAAAGRLLAWCCEQIGQDLGGPLFICIDEVHLLEAPGHTALQHLVKLGRASGIHVVAATQYPTRVALATDAKDQFGIRIAGPLADGRAAHVAGVRGAELLTRPGEALVKQVGQITRCQLAIAGDEDPSWQLLDVAGEQPAEMPVDEAPSPVPTVHPSQAPRPLSAEDRAWIVGRWATEGQLPGVNRTATRLRVGNTAAKRWLSEVQLQLDALGEPDASWFDQPSQVSQPSQASRTGVLLDFQTALASRLA